MGLERKDDDIPLAAGRPQLSRTADRSRRPVGHGGGVQYTQRPIRLAGRFPGPTLSRRSIANAHEPA